MGDEVMGPYEHPMNYGNNEISESRLIEKYNEIVRQYNIK